ncbi:MAG: HU family DNA-binding protein, partial [Candidatus Heimdallarchaeota archaeon]|nr:HU family DNA-binding protein [Candidatus Heimdallarchaeota archaeon]
EKTTYHPLKQKIKTLLEIMKSTLTSGKDIMISGFGEFQVNERSPRKGRNLESSYWEFDDNSSCRPLLEEKYVQDKTIYNKRRLWYILRKFIVMDSSSPDRLDSFISF